MEKKKVAHWHQCVLLYFSNQNTLIVFCHVIKMVTVLVENTIYNRVQKRNLRKSPEIPPFR